MSLVWWTRTFSGVEPFDAIHAARKWLKARGYSIGTMCGAEPMGILLGPYDIAKRRNLRPNEKAGLDGQIDGDKRGGPVTVRLKATPKDESA